MDSRWLKGLSLEDKDRRIKEVNSYKKAFKDLSSLLNEHFLKDEECRNYSDAGWVHTQIAKNERNHVIKEILRLISI